MSRPEAHATKRVVAALIALALLGFAARLMTWSTVFTPAGVELVPADSHYYVRFAQLQLASFPRFTQIDPMVNFPARPRIIWPPLHTEWVAAAVATIGKSDPELGAAWVDPSLALLWLLGLGLLALKVRGPRFALWTVAVLAFAPTAIESGALGNADHHVHEAFVQVLWLILLGQALKPQPQGTPL